MKERERVNPRVFWPMAAIGIAIMGFGVYGLFENSARTHPGQWVRWFVGAAIAHDFVLAPTVAIVGVVAARQGPSRYRAIVQGALLASGIVVLTAYPFVRGYGRRPDNPSVLPNNYVIGLLVVLGVIWVVAGALAWRAQRRRIRAKT
jgi:hypothetical protein